MWNLPYAPRTKFEKRILLKELRSTNNLSKHDRTSNSKENPNENIIRKRNIGTATHPKKKRIIMLEISKRKTKMNIKNNESKWVAPITKDQLKEIFEKYKQLAKREINTYDDIKEEKNPTPEPK